MQLNYSYWGLENNLLTNRMGDPWCGESLWILFVSFILSSWSTKDIDKDELEIASQNKNWF